MKRYRVKEDYFNYWLLAGLAGDENEVFYENELPILAKEWNCPVEELLEKDLEEI